MVRTNGYLNPERKRRAVPFLAQYDCPALALGVRIGVVGVLKSRPTVLNLLFEWLLSTFLKTLGLGRSLELGQRHTGITRSRVEKVINQ